MPKPKFATPAAEPAFAPSYLAAAVAALAVLALYLVTLAPSTAMWDTSEYIVAAYTLGLPHPPGNPLFVLLGRVASLLPIAPTVATRINVLAAVSSAASAGLWFLVTERALAGWFERRWMRLTLATVAALLGATAFTVWNQSVVNEKVYTVALAGIALVAWLTIRWSDAPDGRRADRILILVAYLLGLGYGNHMAGMLAAPAVAIAVLMRRPRAYLRWKLVLACAGAIVLGGSTFATQPIRAAFSPPINEGETTGCRHGLKLDCTFSEETWRAWKYNFDRKQYAPLPLTVRQAPLSAQAGMWWLYFQWQWLRDARGEHPVAQTTLAFVFLSLGLVGGVAHYKRDRRTFWLFGPLLGTMTAALIVYLNFKYGASQAPELGNSVVREVRDRDYFYLWSFSAWGVWAALGLAFVWERLARLADDESVVAGTTAVIVPTRRGWLLAAPVLALAVVPLLGNWRAASRHGETDTRDFAHDLLNSVEPYGVLVTYGDNDTFPLWYAQEVEGIRKDVVIACAELLNTEWYTRGLIRRPVFTYDADSGPAIYRGRQWTKPAGSPIKLTFEQSDSIELFTRLDRPAIFRKGAIVATVDPKNLPNGGLLRADVFVLRMIQDSFPERPIYFARTTAAYGDQLGFTSYLMTQGLARKLLPGPITASRDTIAVPGEGYIDVQRTKALWNDVFLGQQAIIRKGDWIDRPSISVPYAYVSAGLLLAQALDATGDKRGFAKVLDTSRALARVTRLGEIGPLPGESAAPVPLFADSAARVRVPGRKGQ